jgi:hypothetical protein
MLTARRGAWDAAFNALFMQLRSGATDAFYCISPQVRFLPHAYMQGAFPLHHMCGASLPNTASLPQQPAHESLLPGVQDTRRTAFVALFRGAGVGGCAEPHALVSRSSQGLRALLLSEAVPFAMPLAPKGIAEGEAAAAALLADVEASNVGKVC